MDKTEFYQNVVLAFIRKILLGAGTFLVTHGYLSADQVTGITQDVAGIIFMGVALIWTWIAHKSIAKVEAMRIQVALHADPTITTVAGVKQQAADILADRN